MKPSGPPLDYSDDDIASPKKLPLVAHRNQGQFAFPVRWNPSPRPRPSRTMPFPTCHSRKRCPPGRSALHGRHQRSSWSINTKTSVAAPIESHFWRRPLRKTIGHRPRPLVGKRCNRYGHPSRTPYSRQGRTNRYVRRDVRRDGPFQSISPRIFARIGRKRGSDRPTRM